MLKSIAQALNLSAEALFAQAGFDARVDPPRRQCNRNRTTHGPRFTEPQKRALLAVYRSYIGPNDPGTADDAVDI